MNTVRVSVAITGTDDNGQSRPWSQSGSFQCISASDVTITVGSTPTKIVEVNGAGPDTMPSFMYLENLGDSDIAYGCVDDNNRTASHALPAGTCTFFKVYGPTTQAYTYLNNIQLWTDSGTSEVRYILFY